MTQVQAPVVVGAGKTPRRASAATGGDPAPHPLVLIIVLAVPAVGVFVASFRTAAETNSGGWWTALRRRWSSRSRTTSTCSAGRASTSRSSTARDHDPGDRARGDGRGIRGVRVRLDELPRPQRPVRGRGRAARRAAAGHADPGAHPVPRLHLGGFQINGTMLAVWLAHTGYGLPFAIYLLRNYMGGLPKSVFESAAIDGAGPRPRSSGSRCR